MFSLLDRIYLPNLVGFSCRPQNPVAWQLLEVPAARQAVGSTGGCKDEGHTGGVRSAVGGSRTPWCHLWVSCQPSQWPPAPWWSLEWSGDLDGSHWSGGKSRGPTSSLQQGLGVTRTSGLGKNTAALEAGGSVLPEFPTPHTPPSTQSCEYTMGVAKTLDGGRAVSALLCVPPGDWGPVSF